MANNDFYAVSVDDSLWSNRASGWLMQQRENWLTDCCWSEFHWRVLLVRCRCPRPGYNNMWMRNMLLCGAKWRSRPKKGEVNDSMRWAMVFRGQQGQQTVGVVSPRCWHRWNCWGLHWRTGRSSGTRFMAIIASNLSPVCGHLYRFLGSVCSSSAEPATSSCRQGNRQFWSYIERFNNTLRQRVSRLVRKTLSFSKSLDNHIGAIWYFIHYYNASLLV